MFNQVQAEQNQKLIKFEQNIYNHIHFISKMDKSNRLNIKVEFSSNNRNMKKILITGFKNLPKKFMPIFFLGGGG